MDDFSNRLTLEGAGGQTHDTRLTFRVPLEALGKYPRNPYALRIQKMYMKGGYKIFLPLFWSPEVGWVQKNGVR